MNNHWYAVKIKKTEHSKWVWVYVDRENFRSSALSAAMFETDDEAYECRDVVQLAVKPYAIKVVCLMSDSYDV